MKNESTVKALVQYLQASFNTASPAHKFLSVLIVVTMCFGMINPEVYAASRNVLPPVINVTPAEIAFEAANKQAAPAPAANVLPQDAFLNAGALSLPEDLINETKGRVFYVSTTGSDSATGLQGKAWKSISVAVSRLQAGDTLFIEAGTYKQPGAGAVFANSGTAATPITIRGLGNVIIEGVNTSTFNGYTVASNYNPAFNTNGKDYIRIENLTVNNLRSAVTVGPNSSYIDISNINANRNHFGILISGGDHVTVSDVIARNSRNAYRTEAGNGVIPTDILFQNVEAYDSKDVYSNYQIAYNNGDGFIFEDGNRITVRNAISAGHWDAGYDIKASNVLLENITATDVKNGIKVWSPSLIVKNALIYNIVHRANDPVSGEGNAINARTGSISIYNSTIINSASHDFQVDNQGGASKVLLENSIVYNNTGGKLITLIGGSFTDRNNIWYKPGASNAGFTMDSSSRFMDPQLMNIAGKDFHLRATSPAINRGLAGTVAALDRDLLRRVEGAAIDIGAYEYHGGGQTGGDTTPPVINVVTTSNVSTTAATINWTTNEASDSQGQYRKLGETTWLSTSVNPAMLTNHAMGIGGLSANTTYEYRVQSRDAAGNMSAQTEIATFKTLALTRSGGDTVAPVISAVVSSNVTVNGATITWATNEASNTQVQYRRRGDMAWLTTSVNPAMVTQHSIALSGLNAGIVYDFQVKSQDANGNLATQSTVSNFTTTANNLPAPNVPPSGACTTAMCGIANGQTVSGVVKFQPNASIVNSIKKTFYYLDGTASGKVYEAPFTWGGVGGFDTRTLANGTYRLSGLYTTNEGDQLFNITFTVSNGTAVAAPVACNTAICGMSNGQTVKGIVAIYPNAANLENIRKVVYSVNGVLAVRAYTSPYKVNLDTRNYPNGNHILDGYYTNAAGADVPFAINFKVNN